MIGVVVPVHNEEKTLEACIGAIQRAAANPRLHGEQVVIMVVLDSCTDASLRVAQAMGVRTLRLSASNVGQARSAGAQTLLRRNARWLAFTDADSVVSADWLADQLSLDAEVVCGSVAVAWPPGSEALRIRHERTYCDRDGHRHIHGANLGMTARAYRKAGGFPPLKCSEDVALVQALVRLGETICWSAVPRVRTSARLNGRLEGGFADYLLRLAQRPSDEAFT